MVVLVLNGDYKDYAYVTCASEAICCWLHYQTYNFYGV
jgi:hypothetical protein